MDTVPNWHAIAYHVDPHTSTVIKYKKYVIKAPETCEYFDMGAN